MRAGLLSEKISIWQPHIDDTAFGTSSKTSYAVFIPETKARVTNQRGSRANQNDEIVYGYTVTFTIRGYHKIDERMRLKWQGRFYRILNIVPPTREINEYQIDTELVNE